MDNIRKETDEFLDELPKIVTDKPATTSKPQYLNIKTERHTHWLLCMFILVMFSLCTYTLYRQHLEIRFIKDEIIAVQSSDLDKNVQLDQLLTQELNKANTNINEKYNALSDKIAMEFERQVKTSQLTLNEYTSQINNLNDSITQLQNSSSVNILEQEIDSLKNELDKIAIINEVPVELGVGSLNKLNAVSDSIIKIDALNEQILQDLAALKALSDKQDIAPIQNKLSALEKKVEHISKLTLQMEKTRDKEFDAFRAEINRRLNAK